MDRTNACSAYQQADRLIEVIVGTLVNTIIWTLVLGYHFKRSRGRGGIVAEAQSTTSSPSSNPASSSPSAAATSTPTARPSPAVPSFHGLPDKLIRLILVQSDYFTLQALHRTCTDFKDIIDKDPFFDAALFLNRPLTNPTFTKEDMIKVWSLAQTDGRYNTNVYIRPSHVYVHPSYIRTHPVLHELCWDLDRN